MQCTTQDGQILIRCDFTGEAWDQIQPMIEGHQGSVISLKALQVAIEQARPLTQKTSCTMCLRPIEVSDQAWQPDPLPPHANPQAAICWDCIQQADRTFAMDKEVPWERHIPPDERWR